MVFTFGSAGHMTSWKVTCYKNKRVIPIMKSTLTPLSPEKIAHCPVRRPLQLLAIASYNIFKRATNNVVFCLCSKFTSYSNQLLESGMETCELLHMELAPEAVIGENQNSIGRGAACCCYGRRDYRRRFQEGGAAGQGDHLCRHGDRRHRHRHTAQHRIRLNI